MEIKLIWAQDSNSGIGLKNKLPWYLPEDLKNFKQLTSGHSVLMGRKTWMSLPSKNQPLPNRNNIVLTKNNSFKARGATIVNGISAAIGFAKSINSSTLWVIGGAEVFRASCTLAQKLYVTEISADFQCDTFAPIISQMEWKVFTKSEWSISLNNEIRYRFLEYVRVS